MPGAGVEVARNVRVLRVVAADHVGPPVQAAVRPAALEDAVDAAGVLVVGVPVVDDDVRHRLDALAVERCYQGLELCCRPVLGSRIDGQASNHRRRRSARPAVARRA